jgi:hypothetical protein
MEEGESSNEYLTRANAVIRNAAMAGVKDVETQAPWIILAGLGPQFDSSIRGFRSSGEVSMANVTSMLQDTRSDNEASGSKRKIPINYMKILKQKNFYVK